MAGKKDDSIEIDLYKDVVLGAVKIVNQQFRVALPGVVSSFARKTSRAALNLAVRFLGTDRVPREESGVVDCPVITPRGGGYGFHFDLREGDPTVVLCGDSPVRGYYETGDTVTPQFPTGHQYGTSVCFAGGRVSNSTPGQETDPPNAEGTGLIGAEDGSATITFLGTGLPSPQELGTVVIATAGPMASLLLGSSDAADPVACGNEVDFNFNGLIQAITNCVIVPQDGGAAIKAALIAWGQTVLSVKDQKAMVEGPLVPAPP